MNEHIVALDVGDARIGVAVSDETCTIASPYSVINRIGYSKDIAAIKEICSHFDTEIIVSGLPLNMDGTEGFQAEKVRKLCALLENQGFTVIFQDERLTTVTAENAMLESGMHREDRKRRVDKVAAAVILQTYLDSAKNQEEENMQTNDVIQFVDSENRTSCFEVITQLQLEGSSYLALLALDEHGMEPKDDEDARIVFVKEVQGDGDEPGFVIVEDEEINNALFTLFSEYLEN